MSEAPQRRPVRHIVVDERHAGQRIDNFLVAHLKGLPKARIYRILRRGEVRVNRGRIRQHYRLQVGDEVRIPPLALDEPPAPRVPDAERLRTMEARIVHEDGDLLVIDKPSGLAVHGGSGVSAGLIECLRALRPDERELELVHRLDRATSGCLMIAKRRPALRALHDGLRDGSIDKRYLALVRGRWRGPAREVDAPLRKSATRGGERMVTIDPGGKQAGTRFDPIDVTGEASLLGASPLTGRTHQIRVHAASVGHPLAGDPKYGDREFNRRVRTLGLARLFLHASTLGFVHPGTGARLEVAAPLPEDLREVLDALGLEAGSARRARGA